MNFITFTLHVPNSDRTDKAVNSTEKETMLIVREKTRSILSAQGDVVEKAQWELIRKAWADAKKSKKRAVKAKQAAADEMMVPEEPEAFAVSGDPTTESDMLWQKLTVQVDVEEKEAFALWEQVKKESGCEALAWNSFT